MNHLSALTILDRFFLFNQGSSESTHCCGLTECSWRRNVGVDTGKLSDAATSRGKKHREELKKVVAAGDRGVMLFCVSKSDVDTFSPANEIDPDDCDTLRRVAKAGVEVLAYATVVTPTSFELGHELKVELE